MDPLVPALVAVLVANAIDRPPLLAAILADRFGRAGVVTGIAAAQAAGFGIAAVLGAAAAPMLSPNARALLVALALLSAAVSAFGAPRIRDRLEGWRLGGPATALLGGFVLALGDRSQFLVFALAARTPLPLLAAAGAGIAALVLATAAASLGERDWRRLLPSPLRWGVGGLFALVGAWTLVGALRLA